MIDEQLRSKVAQKLGLHEPGYLAENSGILAAWSGGLDSTVMLHLLKTLATHHGFELFAVHLDHNLRPCSASDAAWCRRQAARSGIGIHIEQLFIRPGSSTQNQARAQRYAALFNTANTLQLPLLATAHHADDAIETALINFTRGTSLKGLTALAAEFSSHSDQNTPKNPETTRLIRPILDCTRNELEQYAAHHQLIWREDPSNRSDHYDRNRIRHHVIPELIKTRRDISQLQTTLEHLREDSSALDQIAQNLFQKARHAQPHPQTITLARAPLAKAPPAIVTRTLKLAHTGWNRATLTAALKLLHETPHTPLGHKNPKNHRISLTGATATFRNDTIIIEPTIGRGPRELDHLTAYPARLDITCTGEIRWFNHRIIWKREPYTYNKDLISFESPKTVHFDAKHLPPQLFIRGPIGNERIDVKPPTARKRLKDLWHEHAIPADIRWRWPCLVAKDHNHHEEILWLCNLRRSNKHQIGTETLEIVTFSCTPTASPCKTSHTDSVIL